MAYLIKGKEDKAIFKIAAAQISALRGDIEENIKTHTRAILKATEHDVDFIFFPELSLTGYELDLAQSHALTPDDKRLDPLKSLAAEHDIYISAGAPLNYKNEDDDEDAEINDKPYLSSFIIAPDGNVHNYCKINVHHTESPYFESGSDYVYLNLKGEKIAMAICADLTNPAHPERCADESATIYAAGALISKKGYDKEADMLAGYAKEHDMLVMLSNYNKPSGEYDAAGQSGLWLPDGNTHHAGTTEDAIIIASKDGNDTMEKEGWTTEKISF